MTKNDPSLVMNAPSFTKEAPPRVMDTRCWITIADAAQRDGIIVLGLQAGQPHGLVETQAGGFIHGPGVTAGAAEVLLGPGDEESTALMNPMPPCKVQIAAIHDVERTGFPDQLVEEIGRA